MCVSMCFSFLIEFGLVLAINGECLRNGLRKKKEKKEKERERERVCVRKRRIYGK